MRTSDKSTAFSSDFQAFRSKLLFLTLLLFCLLPLLLTLLFGTLSGVLDFWGKSQGIDALVYIATILAVLDDIFSPAVLCAGICTLGYGIYRMGAKNCRLPLTVAFLSPVFLGLFSFAMTWALVAFRRLSVTPTIFSENIPFYLYSIIREYVVDLCIFLTAFLLCNSRGAKFREKEKYFAAGQQVFGKGSSYDKTMQLTVWISAAIMALNRIIGIVSDFSDISWTVENYGLWSRQSVSILSSGLLLPIVYALLTVIAIRQLSVVFVGKTEELFLDLQRDEEPNAEAEAEAKKRKASPEMRRR